MTQNVLVVGGAGYVGAHTCKMLAAAGFLPVVFDNLTTGHRDFVRWGPFVAGDIRDRAAVSAAIREHRCGAVLHFAARASVPESMSEPAAYYETNVGGTLSLLEGMRDAGCDRLVFSSTCAVYGEPTETPITEATPPAPISPYAASKLMGERIIADVGRANGLRSVVLRYFNACGADPDGEIGELHEPETHLIARAMMALLGHAPDFSVFGADYATPDGTAVRDYVHVLDLAEAHVASLRHLLDGGRDDVLNLGTGRGHSVRQVLAAIETEAGRRLPRTTAPRRPGDPAVLVADAARAREVLGFRIGRSDLPRIVRSAWRWHRKAHPDRAALSPAA